MKQCLSCKTTYSDDSMIYCLNDGTPLAYFEDDSPATKVIQNVNVPSSDSNVSHNPIRINVSGDEQIQTVTPVFYQNPEPTKKGGKGLIIGILAALIALFVIGTVAAIGWFLFVKADTKVETVVNSSKMPTPSNNSNGTNNVSDGNINALSTANTMVSPDPNEELKNKVADLEKKLKDQQKNGKANVPTLPNQPSSGVITARANSPRDGFLALRTEPSSELGERILKIPHGETLVVLGCNARQPGASGRWCKVNYNGNIGWAHDGFMIYNR